MELNEYSYPDKEEEKRKKRVQKNLEKSEKYLEKMHKKLLKKAKVYKLTDQREINAGILEYAKENEILPGFLSKSQLKDPEFMIAYLKAQKRYLAYYIPTGELKNNHSFMIEFLKYKYDTYTVYKNDLSYLMRDFKYLLHDADFLPLLHQTFPQENLLKMIFDILGSNYWPKEKALTQSIILELPKEILMQQIETFGCDAFKYIPNSHKDYCMLAEVSIKKDGFISLKKVPNEIVKNQLFSLLITALNKDGAEKFEEYTLKFLNPHKSGGYMAHNEWHDYQYFDDTCVELQRKILDDNLFWSIISYNKHAENIRPSFKKNLKLAVEAGESYIAYKKASEKAIQATRDKEI